ncbi:hypothetical protein FF38_00627 [Lucilia cuprina]|uniref:Uncharacterized protein n=1 Tax=Lucilia cuprina TaxID=7375 RepID=A0A0L0CC78_LUCCU|nr:hypothetical protein FF38_00627 [Lucilia cuprina]
MEIFFTNIDLVSYICKFLTYEEQFELTQVSSELENIIVNYVWKTKFQEIQIIIIQTRFVVSDTTQPVPKWPYSFFSDMDNVKNIISQLKLQQLILNGIIIPYEGKNNKIDLNLRNLKYYKELDMSQFILHKINFLPHFENLCNLTLRCVEDTYINEDFFISLLKSCKYLTHLHLILCLTEHFKVLPTLHELILEDCEGLTYSNLKTILSGIHLKCFKSLSTTYTGNFEYFSISPSLQKLEIITKDTNFTKLLSFNEKNLINLKELLYYANGDEKLIFSNFGQNLNVLNINSDQFIAEDCLKLKYLHKLKINDGISISDFLLLLKHGHLHELSIKYVYDEILQHEAKALTTNLRYLRLECNRFDDIGNAEDDFLLKLLNLNKELSLAYERLMTTKSIVQISRNRNFPKRFKNINVGGISIDCNYIRNECEETMNLINNIIQSFRKRHFNNNSGQFIAEDCLKLKYLHKLKINDGISISDFLLLLKHGHLHELSIKYVYNINQHEAKALTTNLRYLRLEYIRLSDIRYAEEDFLLKLLNLNKELSLAHERLMTTKSIVQISRNRNFPKRFKNINVGGISIDCNSIRNECEETMNLINNIIQSFRKRNLSYFEFCLNFDIFLMKTGFSGLY